MKRSLWLSMLAAAPLLAATIAAPVAYAQAPAPRPTAPARGGAAPTVPATGGAAPADPYSGSANTGSATGGSPSTGGTSTVPTPTEAQLEAQRLKIWESPEMKLARAYVEEYGRRSKQFTKSDAEQYLAKLRQQSPTEMRQWLERFASKQARSARAAEVAKAARQTAVEQAVARLQAVQQSYENFNQGQTEGALAARQQLNAQQQLAGEMSAAKQADRAAQIDQQLAGNPYSWIYMPPLSVQQRAAASATPGDLRPGDPGNFLRGDAPIPGETAPFSIPGAEAAGAAAGGAAGAAGGGGGTP